MAYYWRAEDVPELADVPQADREMWWCIARNQSRLGHLGRLSGWLYAWPWICLFLTFSHATHHQGLFVAIVCMAMAFAVVFVLDVCLDQPQRRRWLRERMREYRSGRPWLQASSTVVDPECSSEGTARYWRLNDIPELHNLPWKRRRTLWSEAVSRSTTPQGMLGTMLVVFLAGTVAGGACSALFPAVSPLWAALPAMACVSFVVERWFRWPAACRWLREHAHELGRYVPA
jgi:hypothetical protein